MATTTIPVSANGADAAAHAAQMRDMAAALHQRAEANKIVNALYRGFARVKGYLRAAAAAVRTNPIVARVVAAASTVGTFAAGLFSLAGPGNVAKALAFTRTGRKVTVAAVSAAWSVLKAGGRATTGLLGRCGSPGRRAADWLNGAAGVATAAVQAAGGFVTDQVRSLVRKSVKDGRLTRTGWFVLGVTVLAAVLHLYLVMTGVGAVAAIATNIAGGYLPAWASVTSVAISALKFAGAAFAIDSMVSDFFGFMSWAAGIDLKAAEFDAEDVPAPFALATVGYGGLIGVLQGVVQFTAAARACKAVLLFASVVAPGWVGVARVAMAAIALSLAVIAARKSVAMATAAAYEPVVVVDPVPDTPAA